MGVLSRLLAGALGPTPRFRPESFGGIVAMERPAALVYLDRAGARALGHDGGPRWEGPEVGLEGAPLVAPIEVHLMLTSRCAVGCIGCYTASEPAGRPGDLDTEGWKDVLDRLASMGVFHVAMGGGESLGRSDLLSLARHARALGMVPNLTTSGVGLSVDWATEAAQVFGRINVSLDGIESVYAQSRGADTYGLAVAAIEILRRAGAQVGINCVVSRKTYPHLEALVDLAQSLGVDEVELLRFKPAGRGRDVFAAYDLTDEQRMGFMALIRRLYRRRRLRIRLDCSFVPFLITEKPSMAWLRRAGVVGCDGGNHLAAVSADGRLRACSFSEADELPATALPEGWADPELFAPFRRFVERAPEPCRSCAYLPVCRGGCRAVAVHEQGTPWAPDPGCPKVRGLL